MILNPAKYDRLCAAVAPRAIETDAEFDRLVEAMESLDRWQKPLGKNRSA